MNGLEELTFQEACDALEAAYLLGGAEAMRVLWDAMPMLNPKPDMPTIEPWKPGFARAVVVNAVQAAIHDWAKLAAKLAEKDRPLFMREAAGKLRGQFGELAARVGVELLGMSLVVDPTRRW